MSWVILALTLGAAITSIIHGVFMLFGSLVNTGAIFNVSTTVLASLPVVSAIFALIGGIIAFNKSKWGALFLLVAGGLCVPSKDTWLYGGIYFFAMLLCFFLKPERHNDYQDLFYEDDEEPEPEEFSQTQTPQYYLGNESENYAEEEDEVDYLQGGYPEQPAAPSYYNEANIPEPILNGDVDINPPVLNPVANINNEPPKLRRRMSKSCPTCGATVAREARFCSVCGTALSIPVDEELPEAQNSGAADTPGESFEAEKNFAMNNINTNPNVNDGDDEMNSEQAENPKVFVKPKRAASSDFGMAGGTRQKINNNIDAAASSYQEFSKYTRRAKKRKRSAGRKILSILLLVGVVGGALYFLLGLRKLPPGDLPPIAQTKVINNLNANNENNISVTAVPSGSSTTAAPVQDTSIATPIAVAENVLPNFTPAREPKRGMVIGSNVNVRADHTTNSDRVARLNVNSRVEIIGNYNVTSGQHQGIWYNVITGGKEGWIYGRYIQPLGEGLPSGYSNALLKTFGSDKSQLADALGQPTRSSSTSAEWEGLTATFKDDDLTRIRVTSSRRELQNGLKVGMSQTALLQIMGYPSGLSNKILQYNEGNKTGVSVQLDRNNAISVITINSIQ